MNYGDGELDVTVSSLFLRRVCEHLMQDEKEILVLAPGMEISDTTVVDEFWPCDLDMQEFTGARANMDSTTKVLIEMTERGYKFCATIHSHPMNGVTGCIPSGVDKATHRLLEGGGYRTVGIIMSRDGYFRFFTHQLPFTVTVIGEDIERVSENVYQLLPDSGNSDAETQPLAPGTHLVLTTRAMLEGKDTKESPTDRQENVPGFVQADAREAGLLYCGAGGLTESQLRAMARKGYGRLAVIDFDFFTPSNYSRQYSYAEDLYENKALAVAKNLTRECILETEIEAFALSYQDARAHVDWSLYDVGLCNVDNNEARQVFAEDFLKMRKPAVFCAVSDDANCGWVFVQESRPGTPCFGCAFPEMLNDKRHPCPDTPATSDILRVVGGFVTYAVDSLIMSRPRNWNLRYAFLAGFMPDACRMVEQNPECPLCGGK